MVSRPQFLNFTRTFANGAFNVKQNPNSLVNKIIKEFKIYLPKIIDNSLAKATYIAPVEMKNRIKKLTEYYTTEVYPVQGELFVRAYEAMRKPDHVSDEMLHQLQVVVSTLEMTQYTACIWDDFDENAVKRCGKQCWHLVDNNGNAALIDAVIMLCYIQEIISQNFKGKLRDHIVSIINRCNLVGNIGQSLDKLTAQSRCYDKFTMDQYNAINMLKSSFYSVKSPTLCALAMTNMLDDVAYDVVDDVLNDIGISVQIHNDLIDYMNTIDKVKGKTGSDIQEGKCSWVAVAVLQSCNPEQRRVFVENYGSKDPEKLARILQLYEVMDIPKMYEKEQRARCDIFQRKINELPENVTPPVEVFKILFNILQRYVNDTNRYMYDNHQEIIR